MAPFQELKSQRLRETAGEPQQEPLDGPGPAPFAHPARNAARVMTSRRPARIPAAIVMGRVQKCQAADVWLLAATLVGGASVTRVGRLSRPSPHPDQVRTAICSSVVMSG